MIKHPKRNTYICGHHILNHCDGGSNKEYNRLYLWKDKELAWHRLFGHSTLDEVIENYYYFQPLKYTKDFIFIFKDKTDDEIISLLQRVSLIKNALKNA